MPEHKLPFLLAGILLSGALLCSSIRAQEEPVSNLLASDARLNAKTALNHRRKSVSDLLAGVAQATGVRIRAEESLGALRVTAFGEAPAREWMDRLALMLNLSWRKSGPPGEPHYLLYASKENLQEAATRLDRDRAMFRSEMKRLVAAVATDKDLPARDYLAKRVALLRKLEYLGAFHRLVNEIPPPVLDACLRGRELQLSWQQMPELMRQAFASFLEAFAEQNERSNQLSRDRARANGVELPARMPLVAQKLQMACSVSELMEGGRNATLRVQVRSAERNHFSMDVHVRPAQADEQPDAVTERHFEARLMDPTLKEKLTLPREIGAWEPMLERFAAENRRAVLSDAYDCQSVRRFTSTLWPPQPADLPVQLDQFCSLFDYTWNAASGPMVFRRRVWYTLRERQFPDGRLRVWAKTATSNGREGRFRLADLAEMSTLSPVHKAKLQRYVGEAAWREVTRNAQMLSFYSLLREKQRAQLGHAGVAVIDLSPPQRDALLNALLATRFVPEGPEGKPVNPVRVLQQDLSDHTLLTIRTRSGEAYSCRFESRFATELDPWGVIRQ